MSALSDLTLTAHLPTALVPNDDPLAAAALDELARARIQRRLANGRSRSGRSALTVPA